jgi:hypothetical protein
VAADGFQRTTETVDIGTDSPYNAERSPTGQVLESPPLNCNSSAGKGLTGMRDVSTGVGRLALLDRVLCTATEALWTAHWRNQVP